MSAVNVDHPARTCASCTRRARLLVATQGWVCGRCADPHGGILAHWDHQAGRTVEGAPETLDVGDDADPAVDQAVERLARRWGLTAVHLAVHRAARVAPIQRTPQQRRRSAR